MKYGASIDVSSISIQCEVTTQLEQNLAVTSSVKLEKSNNVDMKNWSAVMYTPFPCPTTVSAEA